MQDKILDCENWYKNNKGLYEACGETVKRLIETVLEEKKIPYHSIQFRVKEEGSFLTKCQNKKYEDPISQITDICGLRIITYTNHDVDKIKSVIEQEFNIDEANSVDKIKQMKEDQVGYLSAHYVATINQEREGLTEYHRYKDLKFEIQIRTLLQHAWAEIEHDRSYKFSGELPREIKRRFYLVAGTLELLDREFDCLSDEIDTYANEVREETERGNLDVAINSVSLLEYLSIRLKDYRVDIKSFNGFDKAIVYELQQFGVETLRDLDKIISDKILRGLEWRENCNYLGVLRHIMMATDAKKYFETVWQHDWDCMADRDFESIKKLNPNIENYRDQITVVP